MTREEILAMEVGEELNRLVHRDVFGLNLWIGLKSYSTDISAAWQVVEKMKTEDYRIGVKFCDALLDMCPNSEELMFWLCPKAICKAALLAKLGG